MMSSRCPRWSNSAIRMVRFRCLLSVCEGRGGGRRFVSSKARESYRAGIGCRPDRFIQSWRLILGETPDFPLLVLTAKSTLTDTLGVSVPDSHARLLASAWPRLAASWVQAELGLEPGGGKPPLRIAIRSLGTKGLQQSIAFRQGSTNRSASHRSESSRRTEPNWA